MIHTVKGFSVVNETEVYIFLEFPCFLYGPADIGNVISGSFAFSKPSLYIWKFSVHILLKPSLKDFEHYLASMWNEKNFMVVGTFVSIALLWDWNENWLFPVLWPALRHIESSTFTASPFRISSSSAGIPSPPLALYVVMLPKALLKEEMAIHSSTIAWKIPWTEEPGRLQFTGSQRVRHDWATSPHLI